MSFYARQRFSPGIKGLANRPLTPEEAMVIQNLELQRDGTWKPRPGLTTRVTGLAGDVRHVSNLPGQDFPVVVAGGTLYLVDGNAWTAASKDTGWPTAGRIKSTIGTKSDGERYWLAAKAHTNGSPGSVCKIDSSRNFATISGAPTRTWVEAYGQYTFGINRQPGQAIRYSNAGDSDTWDSGNSFPPQASIGDAQAFITLSESQALILGTDGTGALYGNEEDIFSQGNLMDVGFASIPGLGAVKCGARVAILGGDSRLYLFSPSLDRIDVPVHDDIVTLGDDTGDLCMWYDSVTNHLCVTHDDAGKTWRFDLERNVWSGTWDKVLIGESVATGGASHPRRRQALGYGSKIVTPDHTIYTDDGSAMTCALETVLPSVAAPESEKQCAQLQVDGAGSWTVKLYGRDYPDADWTLLDTRGPQAVHQGAAWFYFAAHTYREGKVRFEATAAEGLRLRSFQCDERAVGVI